MESLARERNKDGEVTASYAYDMDGRPLTITYGWQTFWYVYNAHSDVVVLTDSAGAIKARYEYDEWGRVEAMYDETGRVREGFGTIGDIGTGPTRPVIGPKTPGSSSTGGKGKKGDSGSVATLVEPATGEEPLVAEEEGEFQIQGVIGEPTDLVKMNPYRYGGYRYDRETQYYYLRARYYDGRLARFLSQDTWVGDARTPLTLNRYIYSLNNPVNYLDATGRSAECLCFDGGGEATADPERVQANLNTKSDVELLKAHGFSDEALRVFPHDRLLMALELFLPHSAEVKRWNELAAKKVELGRTWYDDMAEWEAELALIRRNHRATFAVIEVVGGVAEAGAGILACAGVVTCTVGGLALIDGVAHASSGVMDLWDLTFGDERNYGTHNFLLNGAVTISPEHGAWVYSLVSLGLGLGAGGLASGNSIKTVVNGESLLRYNAYGVARSSARGAATSTSRLTSSSPRSSASAAAQVQEFDNALLYEEAALSRRVATLAEARAGQYAGMSSRQGRPTMVSAAYHPPSGRVWYGESGEGTLPAIVDSTMGKRMPEVSLEPWPHVANCAEFKACNAALLEGVPMEELLVYTVRTLPSGIPQPRCLNCQRTVVGPWIISD